MGLLLSQKLVLLVSLDPGAAHPSYDFGSIFQSANGRGLSGRFGEFDGSPDLRSHGTDGEVIRGDIGDVDTPKRTRARRAVAEIDGVHVGQHQQHVGPDLARQQRAGEVLVDDGFDPRRDLT